MGGAGARELLAGGGGERKRRLVTVARAGGIGQSALEGLVAFSAGTSFHCGAWIGRHCV